MLDWLIVGGGIHGTHLAARLIGSAGVSAEQIAIVDPAPALLAQWRRCTANTGMTHLRSPGVHHLDIEPLSLLRFAREGQKGLVRRSQFAAPYNRPALSLFMAHCEEVIRRYGLAARHREDRVVGVDLDCQHAQVSLASGDTLAARNVILAMGASSQPRWPVWAEALRPHSGQIRHVFEPGFSLEPAQYPQRVAVIGAGISGAQAALRLADGQREVHLLSRHPIREHQFDSDPGWIGPKYMRGFLASGSWDARREMISQARHAGSLPPDVHKRLRAAIRRGDVRWQEGVVSQAWVDGAFKLMMGLSVVEVDAVLLATGFDAQRPGGALVDGLIARHALPCAACGYPIVDRSLRWHPNVFVTGPLAELVLGPVARNIVGARRAAERILDLSR